MLVDDINWDDLYNVECENCNLQGERDYYVFKLTTKQDINNDTQPQLRKYDADIHIEINQSPDNLEIIVFSVNSFEEAEQKAKELYKNYEYKKVNG